VTRAIRPLHPHHLAALVIYIWVRRTLDWSDEEAALAQLTGTLRPKADLWNATFTMSYQRFRFRVAQIADLNHAQVEGAVRAQADEIPDGAIVLPVDDDDWFAPTTASMLEREVDPAIDGYVWPSRWVEVPINLHHRLGLIRRRLIPSTPAMWICTTNNYALRKTPSTEPILGSHVKASRWFERELQDATGRVRRLDTARSIANRTLASQTSLGLSKPTIALSTLLRKYRRYRRLYRRPPPPGFDWCQPSLDLMAELMAELHVRPTAG
jgi:hypothetical protein